MRTEMEMAELEDRLTADLLDVIRFTEGVSAKLHRVLNEAEIYQVVKEEFAKSDQYTASILLLTDDGASLKLAETSIAPSKLEVLEKASGLRAEGYKIKLKRSSIYSQVVKEGKTVQANVGDIIREFLPRPLAYLISKTMGYDEKSSILTPLRKHGKVIGVLAMSCTDLCEYLLPSVENLALHISTALELAREHAQRKRAVQALKGYHDHLGELVEERTAELKKVNKKLRQEVGERKQTEEALRKIEREKSAILNSMSEIVVYQDTEHRILWTNKAAAESVGLSTEQLVGRHCYEMWPQSNKPCVGCPVAKARETGRPQEAEMTTPDGRVWFVRGYPILDADKNLVGMVEVVLEITERKQAEEALRESEEFSSSLLTNAPNPVLVIDQDSSVRYVNPAFEKLSGFSSTEVIGGKAPYLWWTEETLAKTSGDLKKAMRKGAVRLEELFKKKNGERFWVEITSAPLRKDGEYKYYLANWVVITERKEAEEALRESQEKLQKMFESVTDGISVIDLNGAIIEANQRTVEMHGFKSRDELLGRNALELVAPRDHDRIAANMRKAIKQGTVRGVEYTLLRMDGSEFPGELSTSILKDAAGNWVGHITIARDITERKQAEEALQGEKNKLQSVVDAMEYTLTIQDRDYNIIYQNEPSRIASGGDHLGEKCYRVYEGREKVCDGCPVEKAFKDGKSHTAERKTVAPSGEVIFWENTANPIRDAGGRIVSCLEIARNITERKRAEEALADEVTRRRLLVDQSLDGIVVLDENAKVYEANQRFAEMLGYTPEEVRELHTWDWDKNFPPEQLLEMGRNVDEKGLHLETQHHRKDGTTIDVDISINGAMCYGGQKLIFCVCRDITERKRMEEALQAEKNKLESIVGAMEDGLTIQDADYNIIYQNEPLLKLWGDRTGEKCYRVYEGKEELCDGCPVKKAFRDGKSHTVEREVVMPSGEVAFWENTANPVRDAGGKIVSCLEITRNITERKQAEEALRESEEKFSKAFRSIADAICITSLKDTKFIEINEAFARFIGYTREEAIGRSAVELGLWVNEEELKRWNKKLQEQGRAYNEEFHSRMKSGEIRIGLASAEIINIGGEPCRIVVIADITEHKQAEEKEKQLQQELYLAQRLASVGELAAGVAHEINNPLTGVLGFSQRLMRKSTDEALSRDLEVIHGEARRAADVVQNLLTFARRRQPKKEYANINDIVQKTLELRDYALHTSNIEVVTAFAPDLPQIMVDFPQMQEVFLNIILNAEQAMNEAHGKGKLIIKTREMKDYVRVSFADNGPGIAPENLDKVFDPFFSTRTERGGTGLGLSACHGIVTEHGGRIYVRSKLGKGATFFVELPLSPIEDNSVS